MYIILIILFYIDTVGFCLCKVFLKKEITDLKRLLG